MSLSVTPSRIARKITVGASVVNLLTLLQAINANISDSAQEVIIQGDVTNTSTVTIGDANVAVSDGGYKFPATPTQSLIYREQARGGNDRIALSSINFIGGAASQALYVTVRF
jgi:hypothetical protein